MFNHNHANMMPQPLIDAIPKNKILRLADILLIVSKVFLVIAALFTVILFGISMLLPSLLEHIAFDPGISSFFSLQSMTPVNILSTARIGSQATLSPFSFWAGFDYFARTLFCLFVFFMLIAKFQMFIRNARTSDSYFTENAGIFKSMFYWLLVLWVVKLLPVYSFANNATGVQGDVLSYTKFSTTFSFSVGYILLAIICLIFSEVFKEGEALRHESEFTI